MARNKYFADAVKAAGIDLNKDYFSLSFNEIDKIEEIRRVFGYSGKNYLGRSKTRQFYYAAQKGK